MNTQTKREGISSPWDIFNIHSHRSSHAFHFAGLGKTTPDPSASITLDGVEVPLGTGVPSGVNDTCLLYNEYPFKKGSPGAVVSLPAAGQPPDWCETVLEQVSRA